MPPQEMVPETLAGWSFEVVNRLCSVGQSETDRHDFKTSLYEPDRASKLTKLCCAFANTYGGYVVVGVKQSVSEWEPLGIEPDAELYADFVKMVRAEPAILVPPPLQLSVPSTQRSIYVFEVPRSTRRPHLPVRDEDRVFWKRVGSECARMSREEVRAQMAEDETKREMLGLLILELRNIRWSLQESASPLAASRLIDGTRYSFEIIDRVTVEAFALLKDDPQTIKVLMTLKKALMHLNADAQRNISQQTFSNGHDHRKQSAESHRKLAEATLSHVEIIIDQVERSLGDRFGVSIPN